jgi:hypothetical protein
VPRKERNTLPTFDSFDTRIKKNAAEKPIDYLLMGHAARSGGDFDSRYSQLGNGRLKLNLLE